VPSISGTLIPIGFEVQAIPERRQVVIVLLFPSAQLSILLGADESAEKLIDSIREAYGLARTGIIPATQMPRGNGRGIVGH
jgi:hypothetical protein